MYSSYDNLRPRTEIESCECDRVTGLLLVDLLGENPLHCATCRREVDAEHIGLTPTETDDIARWFTAASALYRLWLHSGQYESYAKQCLLDPLGQINREGREIARHLSTKVPTQLWYFHDSDDGEPANCPVCAQPLDTDVRWGTGQCINCCIHI